MLVRQKSHSQHDKSHQRQNVSQSHRTVDCDIAETLSPNKEPMARHPVISKPTGRVFFSLGKRVKLMVGKTHPRRGRGIGPLSKTEALAYAKDDGASRDRFAQDRI